MRHAWLGSSRGTAMEGPIAVWEAELLTRSMLNLNPFHPSGGKDVRSPDR